MTKETTARIARIAADILNGKNKKPTRAQILSLAASALVQAEKDEGAVKAWGMERNGVLQPGAALDKGYITSCHVLVAGDKPVPVSIRRIGKRAAKAARDKAGRSG